MRRSGIRFSFKTLLAGLLAFGKAHPRFCATVFVLFLLDVIFTGAALTLLIGFFFGILAAVLVSVPFLLVLLLPFVLLLGVPLWAYAILVGRWLGIDQVRSWPRSSMHWHTLADVLEPECLTETLLNSPKRWVGLAALLVLVLVELLSQGVTSNLALLGWLLVAGLGAVTVALVSVRLLGSWDVMREPKHQPLVASSLLMVPLYFVFTLVLADRAVFDLMEIGVFLLLVVAAHWALMALAPFLDWVGFAQAAEEGWTRPRHHASAESYGMLMLLLLLPVLLALGAMAAFGWISLDYALYAFSHVMDALAEGEKYT